ncbi:MAG: family 16 glycosylhydrolase [Terricaulis sp.]
MNIKRALGLLAIVFVACAPLARAQSAAGQPFVDHMQSWDQRWRISDGWSNGSWTANDWRRRQIVFGRDGAVLTLEPRNGGEKRFSSGEMQTNAVYQYGYFETRLQAARGSGLVNGFFTYTRTGDKVTWDEVDIEIVGRDTRTAQLTYFHAGARRSQTVQLGFDASAAPHSYAFDWQADHIRWYVDGRMVHEETGDGLPIPNEPQRLFVHLWNTTELTDWLGPIQGQGPWVMRVSCVAQAATYAGHTLC